LEQIKAEREELIKKKQEELIQLHEEKQKLASTATDYRRNLQEKKEKAAEMSSELEEEKEKAKHSNRVLSRIVLMLKRIVPILLPEKKDVNISMHNAERFLTLSGLSLEQKATILSFRNRSFPIESINEDTSAPPGVLPLNSIDPDKDKLKPEGEDKIKKDRKEDEEIEGKFVNLAREIIKKREKTAQDKLNALNKIDEDEAKEMKKMEQEKGIFMEKESSKLLGKNANKGKIDEIEKNKKERTKRFIRMQYKNAASHLISGDPSSSTGFLSPGNSKRNIHTGQNGPRIHTATPSKNIP